ncbi:MAG: hypothetical protein ABH821_03685 [archaeon]
MFVKLQRCDRCVRRIHCEFFKPGELCLEEEWDILSLSERKRKFLDKAIYFSRLEQRAGWGGGKKERLKELSKKKESAFETYHDLVEDERREEKWLKTSKNLEYGRQQKTLQ